MKKTLLFTISFFTLFIFSACDNEASQVSYDNVTVPDELVIDEQQVNDPKDFDITAFDNVDYITFEAIIITDENFERLNNELSGKMTDTSLSSKETVVLLIMDNHRDDLSDFDYQNMASLDGDKAKEWRLLNTEMGGHHISGLLIFDGVIDTKTLNLEGLPVGEVNLDFNSASV